MMSLTLDTSQRVRLTGLVGSMKGGTARLMRKAIKVLDVLELSEEEKERIGYREVGPGRVAWDSSETYDLNLEEADLLISCVEDYMRDKNARESWELNDYILMESICGVLGVDPDIGIEEDFNSHTA